MHQTLLVLAAGMGSRYGGLKQIDPLGPGGETIIDYSVYDALRAGFDKVVFVIRKDIEATFRELVGRRFEGRVAVEYAFQELNSLPEGFATPAGRQKPWGTGHAILVAESVVKEPFAVINADDFYGARSFQALASHFGSGAQSYAMVGFVLRNTLSEHGAVSRGVCRLSQEGWLQAVTEMTKIESVSGRVQSVAADGRAVALTGEEIVSMNMWGFTPSLFEHLRREFAEFLRAQGQELKSEFYIPSVVNSLVAGRRERIQVLRSPDSWFGVTYKEDRPQVVRSIRRLIALGQYPERLWA
jgi:UTP-glucose-1-phosphate uridylyltransferase